MTPHEFFHKTFNLNFVKFIDPIMSVVCGKPMLDPFKFDDWLHEKYGNYEEDGLSMQTLLVKHYGQNVADYVCKIIVAEKDLKAQLDDIRSLADRIWSLAAEKDKFIEYVEKEIKSYLPEAEEK